MTQSTAGGETNESSDRQSGKSDRHDFRNVISVAMLAAEMMKRHRHDDALFQQAHQQLKDELKKASQLAAVMDGHR